MWFRQVRLFDLTDGFFKAKNDSSEKDFKELFDSKWLQQSPRFDSSLVSYFSPVLFLFHYILSASTLPSV